MVRKLKGEYAKLGLETKMKKTKYLVLSEEDVKYLEKEDNVEIKGTMKLKHLGFTITKDATTEEK